MKENKNNRVLLIPHQLNKFIESKLRNFFFTSIVFELLNKHIAVNI